MVHTNFPVISHVQHRSGPDGAHQLSRHQQNANSQPDATCKEYFALKLTHNALHTQAWSPSPCSHTIPRDRASDFILNAKHSTHVA